jgi:hypothetical protein
MMVVSIAECKNPTYAKVSNSPSNPNCCKINKKSFRRPIKGNYLLPFLAYLFKAIEPEYRHDN